MEGGAQAMVEFYSEHTTLANHTKYTDSEVWQLSKEVIHDMIIINISLYMFFHLKMFEYMFQRMKKPTKYVPTYNNLNIRSHT